MDAGGARRHLSIVRDRSGRARTRAWALVLAVGLLLVPATASSEASTAREVEVWVAAVPVAWNIAPNGRDGITGSPVPTGESVVRTVVYRRYSAGWKKPADNAPRSSADGLSIPGPLIQLKVGDRLQVHFKNMDTLRNAPHSMHFHGVKYAPASDGAYIPGFSGPGADVEPGKTFTYRLTAGPGTAGVWPYHDHSQSMMESIDGGMYGMLSIHGQDEPMPDREFQVVFAPMGKSFMTIDGRSFVGNTPVFRAKVGELVQWDVMAVGSDFHTFHVHGHRWASATSGGEARDTQTLGPAESYRVRWREDAPGTWLYHCHVEDHMMRGMIGIYRVTR